MKNIKMILLMILFLGIFTNCFATGIADKLPIDKYTSKYDTIIRKEVKRNFSLGLDWRWMKAQVATESAFNPNAVSPVGAKGLSQFMNATFNDVVKRSGYIQDDIFNPRWNLAAQAWYDKKLYNTWRSKRTELSRIQLMMCSYNSGLKYPLNAQKLCIASGKKDCNEWSAIRIYAPNVRGWIYNESLHYVQKISGLMGYKN